MKAMTCCKMTMKGRYTMANPVVTITMTNGDVMKAELYPEIAPNTVNNFISLVQKGFYDGLIFHRSNLINSIKAFNHLAESSILSIKMRCISMHNKELGTC